MKHRIKIDISHYEAVKEGSKVFEIRYNDRGYQKGDTVVLMAWCPENHCMDSSKEYLYYEITYVTGFNQQDGWVVFGIKETKND